jgi:hypothetical protein
MSTDLAYLAGLFDGEGYVRIDNHFHQKNSGNIRYTVNAGVAMTYMPAVRLFHDRWGGVFKGENCFKRANPKNRTIFRWAVTSLKAEAFLLEIQPFSLVKREQIDLAIAFQAHIRTHKSKMVGANGDLALRAKLFAERATLCDQIRLLKKQEFPINVD